jgi:hypothetical protein
MRGFNVFQITDELKEVKVTYSSGEPCTTSDPSTIQVIVNKNESKTRVDEIQ